MVALLKHRSRKETVMNAPANANVWAEIPVTDLAKAKAFYGAVTGYAMIDQDMGPNRTAVFAYTGDGGVAGHLYEGRPASAGTGPTVHLAVSGTTEEAMQRVRDAGGQVVSPVIDIPAGRFAYCLDPDGNSFGVFAA